MGNADIISCGIDKEKVPVEKRALCFEPADSRLRKQFPSDCINATPGAQAVEHINLFAARTERDLSLSQLLRLVNDFPGWQIDNSELRNRVVAAAHTDKSIQRIDGKFVNESGVDLPRLLA